MVISVMANATNVLANGIEITGSIKFSNDMVIEAVAQILERRPFIQGTQRSGQACQAWRATF